jgi:predicted RNase H-like HicB family nuclease
LNTDGQQIKNHFAYQSVSAITGIRKEEDKDMKYKVNLKKTDDGYAVWVPGLPGCWSQGQTEEEALENVKDAIQAYLATVEELSKDKESRYVEVER